MNVNFENEQNKLSLEQLKEKNEQNKPFMNDERTK